ncbi:MAG: glucose-6-phosphate isomerase, partial [Planctomycetaceae bacterium]
MSTTPPWSQFSSYQTRVPSLGLTLDTSRMGCPPAALQALAPRFDQAFADMAQLEQGAIANPDEQRMVGHYWLRAP